MNTQKLKENHRKQIEFNCQPSTVTGVVGECTNLSILFAIDCLEDLRKELKLIISYQNNVMVGVNTSIKEIDTKIAYLKKQLV